MKDGLYGKYTVQKVSGEPVAREAEYFVLRLDTDKHARRAMEAYADSIKDEKPKLAIQIRNWLFRIVANSEQLRQQMPQR